MPPYTLHEDALLAEAIMGEAREPPYQSQEQTKARINELLANRGLPPSARSAIDWSQRYKAYHMLMLNKGDFNEDKCLLAWLPYKPQEFEKIRNLIPSSMPAGRSDNPSYVLMVGKHEAANWKTIGDEMKRTFGGEPDRFDERSLMKAYGFRILPEFRRARRDRTPEPVLAIVAPQVDITQLPTFKNEYVEVFPSIDFSTDWIDGYDFRYDPPSSP